MNWAKNWVYSSSNFQTPNPLGSVISRDSFRQKRRCFLEIVCRSASGISRRTSQAGTRFFANRGANGIDGLLSTGFGVGAEAEKAWIVVGDLSALYDMNAPWILPQLKNQKWRIVVINNGGGKIFSRVKWLRDLPEEAQRIVENRHSLNFEHWASSGTWSIGVFDDAAMLRDDDAAAVVWEIVPDEEQTEAFWEEWK